MAKIYSPNDSYTGISASVSFCNGTGETNNKHLIRWFKEHGYKVEESSTADKKAQSKEDKSTRASSKKSETKQQKSSTADEKAQSKEGE